MNNMIDVGFSDHTDIASMVFLFDVTLFLYGYYMPIMLCEQKK